MCAFCDESPEFVLPEFGYCTFCNSKNRFNVEEHIFLSEERRWWQRCDYRCHQSVSKYHGELLVMHTEESKKYD